MTKPRFGFPFDLRMKEMARCKPSGPAPTWPMHVKGEKQELSRFKVPIELPKYRLANGRTASLQEQWLAEHTDMASSYFEADPELDVVQETQHGLLLQLVKEADLLETFKDRSVVQIEPIVLDESGFVINGNRRLSCWRQLYFDEPAEYPQYSHIDVVVLPHCDDKEIDKIEANLQIKKDIRAKYSWEARAIMMRQKQKQHSFSDSDIGEMYGLSKADVEQARSMLDMADAYLKSRGREHQWSDVRGAEEAFRQLYKASRKTTQLAEQSLLKHAAFALIDKPGNAGERLYSAIPKIQEHLAKVRDKLILEFPALPSKKDDQADELFGSGTQAAAGGIYHLAAEVAKPQNSDKVRELVIHVIETESELQKERANAGYLLKQLIDANSKLQAAVADGMRPDSTIAGANEQLASIEAAVSDIRDWLKSRNA